MKHIKIGHNIYEIGVHDILMCFMLTAAFALDDIKYIDIFSQFLLLTYTICFIIKNRYTSSTLTRYIFWLIIFFILCISSVAWSSNANTTSIRCSFSVLQVGLIGIATLVYGYNENKLYRLIKFYIFTAFIICFRFFIEVPRSSWGQQTRFSNESLFGKNETAVILAYAAVFLLWSHIRKHDSKKHLLMVLLCISIFMLVTMLMGTKSGVILFMLGVAALLIGSSDNAAKLMIRLVLIVALIFVAYKAMLRVPILYNSIGYRIELMLMGLAGKSTDASTLMRMNFAKIAFQTFLKHPFYGIGLDGFRYVNVFEQTYAHNNYLEVLADLGIIGFLVFYVRDIYYLINSIKIRRKESLSIALLVMLLFVDFTGVTYSLENPYVIFCILILITDCNINVNEDRELI